MKVQDVRIDLIVEVQTKTDHFYEGETFLVKGVVNQKGKWFVLSKSITEGGQISQGDGIGVNCVEPIKTELEKVTDNIKKEIGG